MAARTLIAVLLFLGAGLTGCISSDDPSDEGPVVNQTGGPNVDVPDGRGKIIAFEETNQTEAGVGGVDHHHDQWVGRSRVVLFEEDAMMRPTPSPSGATATFRPPQGVYIYEGTSQIEFSLSAPRRHACEGILVQNGHYICTDYTGEGSPAAPAVDDPSGGPSGLKLRYKHASTSEWIDAGEIGWGTPAIIQITDPKQTDMPHATSSIWEFQVVSPNPHDASLVFKAKAEMVRGEGDIPLWPGHPLFYDENRTSRVVVETVEAEACDSTGCTLATDPGPVFASKLVSYGTRTLFIWVNISAVQAPNPATAPNSWYVFHRNATGADNLTSPFDAVNYGMDKKELFWALPVDDGGMDSPYADASRWNFELGASYTTPTPDGAPKYAFYGGVADWAAKYTITVVASSIELAPEQYHMSCLDEQVYCPQPDEAPSG
jgi:hypothetical protein